MAKEKFVFETELDISGLSKSAKQAQKEIREIANQARATSKNAQITGDVKMKAKGIDETNKALKLAQDNVKKLTEGLAQAKVNGSTEKQISDLESQLRKASTQAINLQSDLAKVSQAKVTGDPFSGVKSSADNVRGNLLGVAGSIGNIFSGIKAGADIVTGAFSTVGNYVGGFANRLMDTYDDQVRAQKTLSATLTDGADGYKVFNEHIEKGNALLKSQKGDLNELAATISGYTQMSGDQAFKTVNAINAVGDSLSVSMDGQKQFTLGLAQALGTGALHAQDYNQIMQTALGAEFKKTLIEATNQLNGVKVSTDDMVKSLQKGDVKKNTIASLFGDDWAKKMADYQTNAKGIEVSTSGVNRMLQEGKLSADDFSKVLGSDFVEKLTNSQNALGGMKITQENFKQAMEDGVFGTEQMNKALEMFQNKGQEVASNGASTFSQIKEMVTKGFDQSALSGFQGRMKDTGTDMAELGDSATDLATMAGNALGQLAADGVNSLTKLMDKNGDGKVSNDEFKASFDVVKKHAQDFFNSVNSLNLGGMIKSIGDVIGSLVDLYNQIDSVWQKFDSFLNMGRNVGGKTGLLGKMFGVDDWFDGSGSKYFSSGGGRGFLTQPFDPSYMKGLTNHRPQSMSEPLPMKLQTFSAKSLPMTFDAGGLGSIGRTASKASSSSTTSIGDIIVKTSSGNGEAIAEQIYRRLGRNGVKLPKR